MTNPSVNIPQVATLSNLATVVNTVPKLTCPSGYIIILVMQVQASVTNPSVNIPPAATLPELAAVVDTVPGVCNNYIPQDSTIARFLNVVQLLASNGLYVVLSNNLDTDTTVQNPAKCALYYAYVPTSVQ